MPRPRAFDYDGAIDVALSLFRRHGYDGTSITDLTAGMGIQAPSLYRAFGNKRELFHTAIERHMDEPLRRAAWIRTHGSAREVTSLVLNDFVDESTRPGEAPGCFMVQGALVCAEENSDLAAELAEQRRSIQASLEVSYRRAIQGGELTPETDPKALGIWVATVAFGISVQAASGVDRQALEEVVARTVSALPYSRQT